MIEPSIAMLAGVLGLLAFFEPCTIATHGLFAEYATAGRAGPVARVCWPYGRSGRCS